ncbi:MAG TPA: hypothetical protein ENH34_02825 [Phycisphaerales bacterium]|nr:hypothetical protein [Phycisphaerales bacterium]
MSKKNNNFFEEQIEKIILAIVGLVCVMLLIFRVLISPNLVNYEDRKFAPGDIDNYILSEQAEDLKDKLNRKPEPKKPYEPNVGNFIALVDSAISDIDVSLSWPLPPPVSLDISVKRAYSIPQIPDVNEISVEHIRAVAYVPTEEVDEENVYDEAENEPNDVDFVTVEAKFDVAGLIENFYESFAGEDVQEEWCDPCLAEPVFAAVQLQRQERLSDGSWSDWQIVPRSKIDARRSMFEVIEEVEKLPPGGVKVRLLRFNDKQVTMDLLQPEAYKIASAKEEWFPPSLHKEFVKNREKEKTVEKREALAAVKEEKEKERQKARAERSRTQKTKPPTGGGMEEAFIEMGDPFSATVSAKKTPTKRRRSNERSSEKERPTKNKGVLEPTDDVYDKFEKILITKETDFAKMREPLLFWAYDDTVEPKKSYRYKIRLGVFNPIAGTEQFSEQYKHFKNKVILWSKFSDTTETVEIPGMLYFFPREIQEAAKIVTVQVSRYVLDYWYSKDFYVKQGEVIGKVVETEIGQTEDEITVPEAIDYSTGAVLVDIVPVNDWSGGKNMRPRYYFDMLYTFEGTDIKHIPIKQKYWTKELQLKINEIKKAEKEPREPFRDWDSSPVQRRRDTTRPGGDESDGMEYWMMDDGI